MSEDRLIGQQLDEYRLEKLLGQGGMARVYRGLDVGLKRYAAVKIIDTPFRQDEEYLRRFQVEAQAIAQLDHPNIVSVYRYGRAENVLYMAMKYVEGADLNAVLSGYEKNGELMPWEDVLRILREIASALDYAHSKGVIHRDIKPSNIMLDGSGRAYLTDFGLVLLTAQGTQGQIFGTPQYIAPEQAISSAGAIPQSDFYAIGVILYRMVTGTLPFDHEDMLEIAMLHMTAEPPPPSQHRPEIGHALEQIILKTLAKEPRDRYPDGAALMAALEAVGQELPPPAIMPTLSIMDRVALDMEYLPPPPVSPGIAPASSPMDVSTAETVLPPPPAITQNKSSFSPKMMTIGGIVLLLFLVAGAMAMFGGGDEGDEMETAVYTPSNETTEDTIDAVTSTPAESIDETTPATALSENRDTLIYLPAIASDTVAAEVTDLSITATPAPLPTNTPEPTPTAVPPTTVRLEINDDKNTLFVTNLSDVSVELAPLVFVFKEDDRFTNWPTAELLPETCILVVKEGKSASNKLDKASCLQSAASVEKDWENDFDVYYQDVEMGSCNMKQDRDGCFIEWSTP